MTTGDVLLWSALLLAALGADVLAFRRLRARWQAGQDASGPLDWLAGRWEALAGFVGARAANPQRGLYPGPKVGRTAQGLESADRLRVDVSVTLDVPPGGEVRLTVRAAPDGGLPAVTVDADAPGTARVTLVRPAAVDRGPRLGRLASALPAARAWLDVRAARLPMALFAASMGLYLITRFVGLDSFPIYFFSDEAVQTVLASDFLRDGLRDFRGRLFPTYFQNASYYNLSVSVYAQVIPTLVFGKSVWVTRGTAVVLSSLAAVALSLMLKNVYRVQWWWLGALVLSVTPAWFLHSRTAFETSLMAAAYAGFLYFYLLYRRRNPRYLYPSLACGALAFYSYSGGQLVVVLTGLGLLLSDLRYHWAMRATGWRGLGFLALLALPYARFLIEQPGESLTHLRLLDSYWLRRDLGLADKLGHFGREYLLGLSPAYWFSPASDRDLARHVMRGYGHLPLPALPFMALGLWVCLRGLRQSEHRTLLVALLAAPVGGALTAIGITRVLALVVPAACLTALGIEALRGRFARHAAPRAALALFGLGAAFNLFMLGDALVNGPLWHRDYGLGGMQYGARQVSNEIRAYLARNPAAQVRLTPVWANGTDVLLRFFLADEPRVRLENIDSYLLDPLPLDGDLVFVMVADEYRRASQEAKFAPPRLELVLPYPDGSDGFLFVRLAYSDRADALFAAERAERSQPLTEAVRIGGEMVTVTYSRLDSGRIQDVFDNDAFTLGRTQEANPAIIELAYPSPRVLTGVTVTVGSMDLRLTAHMLASDGSEAAVYQQEYVGLPDDPAVRLNFDGLPVAVSRLRLEIEDMNQTDTAKVHIREIRVD